MTEKRFTLDLEANVDLPILVDTKSGKWWFIRDTVGNCEILCNLLNEIVDENEQLRKELLICQQSNDDGRFQVWEVPPIPKGTRITFSTTERSGKNE